jgi:endoglucanase
LAVRKEPWRFCLHSASLLSGQEPDAGGRQQRPSSAIRVNQTAYVPGGPKRATLVRADRAAQAWNA